MLFVMIKVIIVVTFWHCLEQYPALLHAEHFRMFVDGSKHRKQRLPRIAPTGRKGMSPEPAEAARRSRFLHLSGILVCGCISESEVTERIYVPRNFWSSGLGGAESA
jgi:hypothetical protein